MVLSIKNFRFKDINKKLTPKFIRSFKMLNIIGLQVYRLTLSNKYIKLYNIFSISFLEPWYSRDKISDKVISIPDLEDGNDE